jgi:glycosyltransferase involved in cell wall biosynthesis
MTDLRICFFGSACYSQPLDRTSEKKFRALKALGELFVIGFSPYMLPQRFTEHAHFYLIPKLPVPFMRYAELFALGPLLALWLILRHKVQVLTAQSPYEGFAVALAKKVAGYLGHKVVFVIESHGDFEEDLFLQRRILLPRLYRFLMRCTAHFAFEHADLLRAVSDSTRQQLEQWAPGRPIFQFVAWTDMEVFLQASINEEEHPFQNILYVGSLIPRKGVHHLIDAFARVTKNFPQARLAIVGRDENKTYAAQLKEQVRRLSLDGRVQFLREVRQAELTMWMRRACVFVLPSISEGLGRVVIEAMATCTPVIGSRVGGIPEMVEDGVTGFLVRPGDEATLAEKIRWVLEHSDEAREMGRRARLFAERFFSTDIYVQGYARVLEEAVAKTCRLRV